MITNLSHVMTLANGIIGVSVLAMPYCFKQCGIILGILILFLSSVLSKFACHLLVKSAVMSRRRNFEVLAFHAFGRTGKLLAELFIIGFLMGTCIAFFVVVGDLGPEIVGKMMGKRSEEIRTTLLVIMAVSVILPLGLLRNVDSLSTICTATIGFYLCLVFKIMTESMGHIFATDWYDKVFYWRPSGILQCLPIFSMALFCQTQLFEIYETIPNACLDKMNRVVDSALNICTIVYIFVGFFGYVAFCTLPFTGNILMSFEPSLSSEAIKFGFVLSVAFSFPLVIFPCRASLNSLLFRWAHSHETSSNYIPETRFRWLTMLIVAVSLITGILIPNIEFVLGLVGSTIGVMICLMFPAAFFISISSKNTNERLLAQAMLFIGVWIMILGTYANLYAMEESANAKLTMTTGDSLSHSNNIPLRLNNDPDVQVLPPLPKIDEAPSIDETNFKQLEPRNIIPNTNSKDDVRQEPPIPVERVVVTEKTILDTKKPESQLIPSLPPVVEKNIDAIKNLNKNSIEEVGEEKRKGEVEKKGDEVVVLKAEEKMKEIEMNEERKAAMHKVDNSIHLDAFRKEDTELAADGNYELAARDAEHDEKHEELRKTLEKHEKEQRQMLQEQKEIINNLKQHKQEFEKEKKSKLAIKQGKKVERDDKDIGIDNTDHSAKDVKPISKEGDVKILNKSFEVVKNGFKHPEVGEKETREKNEHKNYQNLGLDEVEKNKTVKRSRGPILSALVKQISNSSIVNDIPKHEKMDMPNSNLEGNQKIEAKGVAGKDEAANLSNNNVMKLTNDNLSVPIALAMREKAKQNDNKIAIGRDILEDDRKDRSKRNIDELLVNKNEKNKTNLENSKINSVQSFVNDATKAETDLDQECSQSDKSANNNMNEFEKRKNGAKIEKKDKIVEEKPTTELLLIKTNSYLSDHNFGSPETLDKNLDLKSNFDKSNQRDLKPVGSENGDRK